MNHHYDNKSKGELSDSFDSSFCPYCNKNHIVKFGKDKKAHLLQLLIRYLAILKKNLINGLNLFESILHGDTIKQSA